MQSPFLHVFYIQLIIIYNDQYGCILSLGWTGQQVMTVDGMKLWRGVSDRKVLQAGMNWICPKMAPSKPMVSNDLSSYALFRKSCFGMCSMSAILGMNYLAGIRMTLQLDCRFAFLRVH